MSYLKAESNPFFETTHLRQTDLAMSDSGLMPRTYNDLTSSIPSFRGQKRKMHDELLTTPERSTTSTDSLITPPRTSKKPRTVPSSPLSEHNPIYETPQTPTNRQDYSISSKLNLSPNYRYSFTSPENYAINSTNINYSFSNRSNDTENIEVEPLELRLPQVKLMNNKQSGSMYNYADTCYPYTLPGSVLAKDNGLRLSTWRQTCDSRVRHGYSDDLRSYRKYSDELSEVAHEQIKNTDINPPSLSDTTIFPHINAINNYVEKMVEYPKVDVRRNFLFDNIEEQARTLLQIRHKPTERKASINLQQTKISLPPCSEILNPAYFDKSMIHASGLTSVEYDQFHNPNAFSIEFQKNPKTFHNGKEVRIGQEYTFVDTPKNSHTQLGAHKLHNTGRCTSFNCTHQSSNFDFMQPATNIHYSARSADPYYDLSQQIIEDTCIMPPSSNTCTAQTLFHNQPLKIQKTRRQSSVSTSSKSSNKTRSKNAKSPLLPAASLRRSSQGSSRRSSRKSSVGSQSDTTVVGTHFMRTRSGNSSRKASNETVMTAEVPASVENTPTSTPVSIPIETTSDEFKSAQFTTVNYDYCLDNKSNSMKLPPPHNMNQYRLPENHEKLFVLNTNSQQKHSSKNMNHFFNNNKSDYNPQGNINSVLNMSEARKFTDKDSQSHSSKSNKTCISCKSVTSPCWRPSWSPDQGQLCNSCGLRYRKTKARCYNPHCLKIPSKSEWNLMIKRGKLLLEVYDDLGRPNGQQMCYRCLDCDSAMQLLR